MPIAALIALLAAGAANAGVSAVATAVALPITDARAIRVTGELGEEAWRAASPVNDFLQREPDEGGDPSERTEFRVAYDRTTLYVKVRAFDRDPDKIITYLTRRDQDSPCDWLYVLIDSYHDKRTAYEFGVNPSGVKRDRYWFNDNNVDDSWDAVWDVTVSRDAQGWAAEFRIPFSQLRFNPAQQTTFGFAVKRQIGRLNETATWPLLARSASGYVSSFGELSGLSMAASPKKLEVMPYVVSDLTRQRAGGNPLLKNADPGMSLGMDAKYSLTPGLTLTATVNPDFGQVEADPAVVNLSAFETFFSERRPFFVEGSGTFNFGLDCNDGACTGLFYSRRIGRAPQGTDALPSGDNVYTDVPTQTTILGAGKLTGRVGKYSIGVLQAATQEQRADVWDAGSIGRSVVEPLASYTVGRVRREFANQSSIGAMVTSANRQVPASLEFLVAHAAAIGTDVDVRFKKRYAITGYLVGSRVSGDPEAIDNIQENSRHYFQRPDLTSAALDPSRTSLAGSSGSIAVSKISGQYVRFNSNVNFKTPGFDINDLGFLRRADQRNMGNWLQFRSDRPNRFFRSRMINFNQWRAWNFDGDRLHGGENINAHAVFANNWSIGGGYNWEHGGFDDRGTRGGPAVRVNPGRNLWFYVNGDRRKRVYANYFGSAGGDQFGTHWFEASPDVTYRPVPAIMATIGVRVNHSTDDSQWVETLDDNGTSHYVFGHLDQTTVALTGRLNYTMTPNLSLQLYAQPFVSAGDYNRFKQLAAPRSAGYADRYAAFDYGGDPDFNVKSFRTTNVLRWEYKPGSSLFIVWQQARENDDVPGGFRFGRDVRDIFGVAPRNVFLVKLAYWLNY